MAYLDVEGWETQGQVKGDGYGEAKVVVKIWLKKTRGRTDKVEEVW